MSGDIVYMTPDKKGSIGRYQMSWGDALAAAKATTEPLQAINLNVNVPADASVRFATYTADVRSLLRQQGPLYIQDANLPCETDIKVSAKTALEIGKSAFRKAEFDKGYCWVKRSVDMGDKHAIVVLGVAYAKGWGVPVNATKAADYFKESAYKYVDVWGIYFLKECMRHGFGIPVDKDASYKLDVWLDLNDEGKKLIMSIGADDRDVVEGLQRLELALMPPTKQIRKCSNVTQQCHEETIEDDDEYQRELDRINHPAN